jgi:hypothetical protein
MKPKIVTLLTVLFLSSCGEKELDLRNEITSEKLIATWLDIGQISGFGDPINSSWKGALITFIPDGTFQSPNEDKILGIGNKGKWTYDESLKKISFEYDNEVLPGTENYKINKYWIINSLENNILDVDQYLFRAKSDIINPLTNEVIGIIDPVDIRIWRRLGKQ